MSEAEVDAVVRMLMALASVPPDTRTKTLATVARLYIDSGQDPSWLSPRERELLATVGLISTGDRPCPKNEKRRSVG